MSHVNMLSALRQCQKHVVKLTFMSLLKVPARNYAKQYYTVQCNSHKIHYNKGTTARLQRTIILHTEVVRANEPICKRSIIVIRKMK